ncbi:MAG: complex I NDUFA9 subunit family protein [Acidibrevibacterium sp.]|uniref:complex I NDUFA9 subunit family protein n=1 Tax=Acidibrevibacterium sp. TaxID=2606776 RepID=UPI003D0855AC
MTTRKVATVFGGAGFIGRYVVKRLAQRGVVVRIGSRDPDKALFLKPMGAVGQIVPLYAPLNDEKSVARAVEGADMVINLVGLLTERRPGDFARAHAEGAERVATLARAAGVRGLVHVSAIGADPASPSRYAATKGEGEARLRAAFPTATILRPSVVFGPEDEFFNRLGRIALLSPIMPVIAGGTRMQPVYVGDVADAIMVALENPDAAGGIYELGGPRVWQFREIVEYVVKVTGRRRKLIALPMALVALGAALAEHLPGKPLTRDQLLLLARDNVVAPGAPDLATLGITPTPVELVVPEYLRLYRRGGGHMMLVSV